MTTKVRDEAKLPQWAQEELALLRRRLAEAQDALTAERGGHTDSPLQVRDITRGTQRGLDPTFETPRIHIGDETWDDGRWKYWLDIRRDKQGRVELYSNETIHLIAQSTNLIIVDAAERLEYSADVGVRNLGHRLMQELVAKGLDWQDGLNMIRDADTPTVKATRNRRR